MNTDIAEILKTIISDVPWLDKVAGAVRAVTISQMTDDPAKPRRKSFPVGCNVTDTDCANENKLRELSPNSKYKSVVFFEDYGSRVVSKDGVYINMQSTLRLVAWINGKRLGYKGCTLSSIGVISILKVLNAINKPLNNGNFTKIVISGISEEPKSAAIFSRYTFDEQATQYLMHPYDYFALNLQVAFSIPMSCVADFEILPETC